MDVNTPTPSEQLPEEVIAALAGRRKIEAIRLLREAWGIDLKAAKEEVERFVAQYPQQASIARGPREENVLGRFVFLLVVVGLFVAGYVLLVKA